MPKYTDAQKQQWADQRQQQLSAIDVVWTHIGYIRRKLHSLNASVEIKTIRGAGYALEVRSC